MSGSMDVLERLFCIVLTPLSGDVFVTADIYVLQ